MGDFEGYARYKLGRGHWNRTASKGIGVGGTLDLEYQGKN